MKTNYTPDQLTFNFVTCRIPMPHLTFVSLPPLLTVKVTVIVEFFPLCRMHGFSLHGVIVKFDTLLNFDPVKEKL